MHCTPAPNSPLPERLTIDVTVARDFSDDRRGRHKAALELFDLARQETVQLFTAPQAYRLDVSGDLAEQIDAAFAGESVEVGPQLAYPSEVTYPAKDLYPGAWVPGFSEAWAAIIASWEAHEGTPPGAVDAWHVESHVLNRGDVFVTDDRSLLRMCQRLRDEHDVPIVAMRIEDYLEARRRAL